MLENPLSVPFLKNIDEKNHLEVRQRLIDAAEGRLITVVEEFDKAFDILSRHPKTVTMFGSARLSQDHAVCKQAFATAWALSKHGYAVVTGGGGGVMEASNRGAMKAGGPSIGFNIKLPMEQRLNDYTTEHYTFEHFFGRKVAMTLDSNGYIYIGGGFGTFDELFEIMTLVQTGIVPTVPIILFGKDYWAPLDSIIRGTLADKYGTIHDDDTELYTITDDITEVVNLISTHTYEKSRKNMNMRATRLRKLWGYE